MELHKLRVAYDLAKAVSRDPITGKPYTDRDFAHDYLKCNFSMVAKVLSGKAKSKPVIESLIRFISKKSIQIEVAQLLIKELPLLSENQ